MLTKRVKEKRLVGEHEEDHLVEGVDFLRLKSSYDRQNGLQQFEDLSQNENVAEFQAKLNREKEN